MEDTGADKLQQFGALFDLTLDFLLVLDIALDQLLTLLNLLLLVAFDLFGHIGAELNLHFLAQFLLETLLFHLFVLRLFYFALAFFALFLPGQGCRFQVSFQRGILCCRFSGDRGADHDLAHGSLNSLLVGLPRQELLPNIVLYNILSLPNLVSLMLLSVEELRD